MKAKRLTLEARGRREGKTSLEYSNHSKRRRRYRKDITDDLILVTLSRGRRSKDSRWPDVLNSSMRIPQTGRRLKVVYRVLGRKRYRIITAYWLD